MSRTLLKVRARKVPKSRIHKDRGLGLKTTRLITAESIAIHALTTFGSDEKARHWMNRPNALFGGKTPLQVMQADPVEVEAELVRIDHGVYV